MVRFRRQRNKGQVGIDYAMIIAMVVACFAALFVFRQYITGKWRANIDIIGQGEQYVPQLD